MLANWLRRILVSRNPILTNGRRKRCRATCRLYLERLEDRVNPATVDWIASGSFGTNWSTPTNWSTGAIPGPADTAVFDSSFSSVPSTVDTNFTVGGIQIDVNYLSTLTVSAASLSLTTASGGPGSFTQSATSSSFILAGSGTTVAVDGNWTGGGLFTANGGTVQFVGTGTQVLNSGTQAFSILDIGANTQLQLASATSATTITNAGDFQLKGFGLTVGGAFTNTGAVDAFGTEAITLSGGNDTHEGSWTYTGDGTGGSNTINTFGGTGYFNLAIADTHATPDTFLLSSSLSVNGLFALEGGTFNANGQSTAVIGPTDVSVSAGGVPAPPSAYLAGSATQSINGGLNLGAGGVFTGSTGNVNVTGNLSLAAGAAVTAPSTAFTVSGNLTDSGTFTGSAGTVSVTGNLTVSAGATMTAPSAALTVSGNFADSGTFTGSTGTMNVNGSVTVSSGAKMTAPSATLILLGSFANSGTFTANGGTVQLSGSAESLSGATTFFNLTKTVAIADTLTFGTGAANLTTVTGTLTLQGTSSGETGSPAVLKLRSATAGTQWQMDVQGSNNLSFVDVQDSDNVDTVASPTVLKGISSVDSGNNINWLFTTTATGGAVSFDSPGGTFSLTENGTNGELRDANNNLIDSRSLLAVTTFTFNGRAATANTLTVGLPVGLPLIFTGPINFNGGTGGTNALFISGGTLTTEAVTYSGTGAGTCSLTSTILTTLTLTVDFSNTTGLNVAGTSPATLTMQLPSAAETATLTDSGDSAVSTISTSSGDVVPTSFTDPTATYQLTGGAGNDNITLKRTAFTSAAYVLDGGGGSNTLTVDLSAVTAPDFVAMTGAFINSGRLDAPTTNITYQSTGGTFGGGVTVDLGSGGNLVNLEGTQASAPTLVNTGAGNDNVVVSSNANAANGLLNTFPAALTVDAGGGSNKLIVSDAGDTANDQMFVTSSAISLVQAKFLLNYKATGGTFINNVEVSSGSGSDTITVQSLVPSVHTGVFGHGSDAFVVSLSAATAAIDLVVLGGPGTNSLTVSLTTETAADLMYLTAGAFTSAGFGCVLWYGAGAGTFGGGLTVSLGSGVNTVFIQGTAANAPTTVNSGAGNDAIVVSSNPSPLLGLLNTFASPLTVDAGGIQNVLLVSDAAETANEATTVTAGQIVFANENFTLNYSAPNGSFSSPASANGAGVQVAEGSGSDTITLQGGITNNPTAIYGNGGNDTFQVNVPATVPYVNLTLDGGFGSNTLTVTSVPSGATVSQQSTGTGQGVLNVQVPGSVPGAINFISMGQVST